MAKNFIVYRSSAGSGKTYTLVRDYITMALATNYPGRFRQILAITFTNKAAEEMKDRVLTNLAGLAHEDNHGLMPFLTSALETDSNTIQKRAHATLQLMLHSYSELAISTIDKFMHQLVRAFARDLSLSFDFEVETDKTPLLEEAVARIIERVGTDELLTNMLVDWVESQIENDKSWQIERNLVDTGKSMLGNRSKYYLKQLESFPVEQFSALSNEINRFAKNYEKEIAECGKLAMQSIGLKNLDSSVFHYKDRGIFGYFKKISEGDVTKCPSKTVITSIDENKIANKGAPEPEKSSIAEIAPVLHDCFTQIENIRKERGSTYLLAKDLLKNLHQLLLLNEIHQSLEELKEERNLIFVDDFHTLISEVVKNEPAPFIYERTGQRFRHILIDEFQDTSVLQWNNFLPLVTDALSTGGTAMLVGDGKQAIYRWRGGEVGQFDQLPKIYPPSDDPIAREREALLNDQFFPRELEENYRSLGEVVRFNNDLFEFLRNDIPAEMQTVYGNVRQNITKPDTGLVTFDFLEFKNNEEGHPLYVERTGEFIQECVEDGYQQRDICIITRSNKEGKIVVNALNGSAIGGERIEFISDDSLMIARNPDVKIVVSAFRYLSDQEHIGYAFDFLLRLVGRFENKSSQHDILEKYTTRDEKNKLVRVEIGKYLHSKDISWNHDILLRRNLYDLAEELARLLRLDGTDSPYWSFFKQQLLNYSNENGNDLVAMLLWWQDNSEKLSLSVPEDSNAIRILSIHKSKGLQFPVVILPFADWQFKMNHATHWAQTPDSFKASFDNQVPEVMISGFTKALFDTDLKDQIDEENTRTLLDNLNLLYVAATRARERLYLLSKKSGRAGNTPSNMDQWLNAYADHKEWNDFPVRLGSRVHREEYYPHSDAEESTVAPSATPITVALNSGWEKKIKINREAGELVAGRIDSTSRATGNLVHRILAEIKSAENLVELIDTYIERGIIDSEQASFIREKTAALLESDQTKNWFGDHERTLIEHAIVTESGITFRPDRIMIDGDRAIIVDYKTGAMKPEHEVQIQQYGQLLRQMNYNCELFLYYLDDNRLVAVSPEPQTSLF